MEIIAQKIAGGQQIKNSNLINERKQQKRLKHRSRKAEKKPVHANMAIL